MASCCKNSVFRFITLSFALILLVSHAKAGNVSAESNAQFEIYIISAVESGTSNPADVLIDANVSFFNIISNNIVPNGSINQTIAAFSNGILQDLQSLGGTVSEVVGPSGIAFTSPSGSEPAALDVTYTLQASATAPGGGTAERQNLINVLPDILYVMNPNSFSVDIEYAIVATVSGSALTDGVQGDSAMSSSSLNIFEDGSFSNINISDSNSDNCPTSPGDSYCVTQTVFSSGIVTIEDDFPVQITVTGNTDVMVFATDEVAESPTPVNVPMPPLAILLSLCSLLAVACMYMRRVSQ